MFCRILAGVNSLLLAAALAAGCGNEPASTGHTAQPEAWSNIDSPGSLGASLERRLDALPLAGESAIIPWAGNYWPTYLDNINHRWDGPYSDSPAKKYEKAFGLTGVEDAVSLAHGIDALRDRQPCTADAGCNYLAGEKCAIRTGQSAGYCVGYWWGICHAWAPASLLLPEPQVPVSLNGVTFQVNDLKALASLVHDDTRMRFVSLRCNATATQDEIAFDGSGRPAGATASCRDTNPGTLHVLLANWLGLRRLALLYDRVFDGEVWNQPLRGYRVLQQREVTARQANALLAVSAGGTTVTRSGTVARGVWAHQGSFSVAAGSVFKVLMSGSNDADLYVRFNATPTSTAYGCRSLGVTSAETCYLTVPAGATRAYVSVLGYAASSSYRLSITSGASTPSAYALNGLAARLFHVKSEVDYITESSAETDGPLTPSIGSYTVVDRLEYVLEVDGGGRVIGGEWVGASKTAHPDFVWVPLAASGEAVAGGAITYPRVKMLLERAGAPSSAVPVERTVQRSGTVLQGTWKHYGPFNVAADAELVATLEGDGDADLYVRRGAGSTPSTFDCRPYRTGSRESCALGGGAAYFVSVYGYSAKSNFQLSVRFTEGPAGPAGTPTPPVAHLSESGALAAGGMRRYSLLLPAGERIVLRTQAAGDVDLYVDMNQLPTRESFLQREWTSSGNETMYFTARTAGTLHVLLYGYQASSFLLTSAAN